ncbi:MAG: Cof-type HAD-IIB family hydrolase [Paenibacillaceae bacterium]
MYKLVAIDLDDTLLNDDMEISEATKTTLAEAVAQAVIITLATGRMYASAAKIAKQLQLNVPLITYQGALVKNSLDGHILYERYVPSDVAEWVYDYCKEHGLHLQGYVNDQLYVQEENEKIIAYSKLSNIPYIVEPNFASVLAQPQTKLLIIDESAKLDLLGDHFRSVLGERAHVTKSKPNFLEIMHPEGTKGSALRFLTEHYNCTLAETIAIGDSWNDHDMVEVAGLGVAMANAVQPLKDIADFITASNNEDGVKLVIDQFVLNRASV